MPDETLLARVDSLIRKADAVLATHTPNPPNVIGFPTLDAGAFAEWRTQTLAFMTELLGAEHIYTRQFMEDVTGGHRPQVRAGKGILQGLREDIQGGIIGLKRAEGLCNAFEAVERICDRFHQVARQLRQRHGDRPTLSVADEYDVQDLLHTLLRLYFDDVRPEEYAPSYAGKATRMDFLIKGEKTVLEVKKTRASMSAADLGTQLIEDIERYQGHPDCRTLICFVYDPEGLLPNPKGLESDLKRDSDSLRVRVLIRP